MRIPEGHGVGRHRGDIEDLAWACLRTANEAPELRLGDRVSNVFRIKSRRVELHDAFRSQLMHSVVYYPGQEFGIIGEHNNGALEEYPTDNVNANVRMLELSQMELGVHDLRRVVTEAEREMCPGVMAELKTTLRMYDQEEGFERASISVVWPAFNEYVVDQSMRLYSQGSHGASGVYPHTDANIRLIGGSLVHEVDPEQILAVEEVRHKFGDAVLRGLTIAEAYNIIVPEDRLV